MLDLVQNKEGKVGYGKIILSAYKALVFFKLLSERPCTKNDIKKVLKSISFVNSQISDDSLRVYFNSLKSVGFVVDKRLTGKKFREYEYCISQTPFKPVLSSKQIDKMIELYDICTNNMDFDKLLRIDLFYRKLIQYIDSEEFLSKYKDNSKLSGFNEGLLKDLNECCLNKDVVTVLYESPHSGLKQIPIVAKEIIVKNHKLYLKGFGKEYNEEAIFLIDRIHNIVGTEPYDGSDLTNTLPDMIYELYDFDEPLDDDETLEETTDYCRKIRRIVKNKLLTYQRILHFGSSCKVLGPEMYRNDIIDALKSIKEVYSE